MNESTSEILKRVGVIGDIHTESTFLDKALQFLVQSNLGHILSVGDIVDGKGDLDQCCELLEKYNVIAVRGNHDRWFLEDDMRDLKEATQWIGVHPKSQDYLAKLPITRQFETLAGALLLCHGLAKHDMAKLTPDDYGYAIESNFELQDLIRSKQFRFIANGHTHQRMVRTFEDLTIINEGTLKYDHEPCFVIIDFEKSMVEFYDFREESIVQGAQVQL